MNNGIAVNVANTNHGIDWTIARVVKTVPGVLEEKNHRDHSNQEKPGDDEPGQWLPTP